MYQWDLPDILEQLAELLSDLGIRVQVVGDALNIGYIEGAIHTANRVAREL